MSVILCFVHISLLDLNESFISAISPEMSAQQKFWQMPELIEKVLEKLDSSTILCLVRAHKYTQSVVRGITAWKKLLAKNFPIVTTKVATDIAHIINVVGKDSTKIIELLDQICLGNPPTGDQSLDVYSRTSHHTISLQGFMVVEEVEAYFGNRQITVKKFKLAWVGVGLESDVVTALARRVSSQVEKLSTAVIGDIEVLRVEIYFRIITYIQVIFRSQWFIVVIVQVTSDEEAVELSTLLQACSLEKFHLGCLAVRDVGPQGWKKLAEGISQHNWLERLRTNKPSLSCAEEQVLRQVWVSLRIFGTIDIEEESDYLAVETEVIRRDTGAPGLARLCSVCNTTDTL